MDTPEILSRERLWSPRVGVAAVLGGLLALLGFILLQSSLGGDANFESLEEAHKNSSTVWLAGAATCVGYLLLTAPLFFLFRAAQVRSPRVKNQMVGLVVLGPLLLGISAPLISGGTQEAADSYLAGSAKLTLTPAEAKKECDEDKQGQSAKEFGEEFEPAAGQTPLVACEDKKAEEDKASNAIKDSSLLRIGQFAGLAGGLSLVIGLLYTGLWAMRTGLLTRFWGSLGMAVGFASLIGFSPLTFIWFVYVGILLLGVLPGGKPPAWDAGEAVPWPTPGQKAAAAMEPDDPDTIDVGSEEIDSTDPPEPPYGNGSGEPPRKRKKRD
ncbi:MAG: hypothetical protein QOF13_1271 [Solirubrobacterales bacterium]|nr:hypothetical protein [Solirubrobacterales bacterium]